MKIERLDQIGDEPLTADLVIVGGGPAAFAIARELSDTPLRILVLESGLLRQTPEHETLNRVDSVGDPTGPAQRGKRRHFHGESLPFWSGDDQGFGVRCRGLGGSTQAWAGKSTAFGPMDYLARDWVAHSGWPFGAEVMSPFVGRAAELLNLGPSLYDETFWPLTGAPPPDPPLDPTLLSQVFWQFARSRTHRLDFMQFGREFAELKAANVRVVIDATVRSLHADGDGGAFTHLEVSTLAGRRRVVRARAAVLAAGAIENARLLLLSGRATGQPMGNSGGLVGRFLLDHPSARIGRFRQEDCAAITGRFGFYGIRHGGQTHIFQHGLQLSPELQRREKLLNCAAYMMEDRAPDDPWEAVKRLVKGRSTETASDFVHAVAGGGLMAQGLAARALTSDRMPAVARKLIADWAARHFPNMAVRQHRDRSLPHKLMGIDLDALTEQSPDADSRITLSDSLDPLGSPMARIDWRIDRRAQDALVRMGHVVRAEFRRIGLPEPTLEPWVADERPEDGAIIDMAHTAGATRMADSPAQGVVDSDCQVFDTPSLYVAGASVFPTNGHANPTLMIVATAIRLADQLRIRLGAG